MDRLTGMLLVLVAVAVALPVIAAFAQSLLPLLIALLVLLGFVRLLIPPRFRRKS